MFWVTHAPNLQVLVTEPASGSNGSMLIHHWLWFINGGATLIRVILGHSKNAGWLGTSKLLKIWPWLVLKNRLFKLYTYIFKSNIFDMIQVLDLLWVMTVNSSSSPAVPEISRPSLRDLKIPARWNNTKCLSQRRWGVWNVFEAYLHDKSLFSIEILA